MPTVIDPLKDRNLLDELKALIFELVEMEVDIARLDVSDQMTSMRRAKKALVLHVKHTQALKKKVDSIRKDNLKEKEESVNS